MVGQVQRTVSKLKMVHTYLENSHQGNSAITAVADTLMAACANQNGGSSKQYSFPCLDQLASKCVPHWNTVATDVVTQYRAMYRAKHLQNRLKARIWTMDIARSRNSVAILAIPDTNLYKTW